MKKMALLRKTLGCALIICFIFFIYKTLYAYFGKLTQFSLHPDFLALLFSFIAMLFWLLLYQYSWETVLRKTCVKDHCIHWVFTSFAFYKSLLARYTPGKVWQFVVRVEALVPYGLARKDSIRSVIYEQLHSIGATVVLALCIIPLCWNKVVVGGNILFLSLFYICALLLIVMWCFFPNIFMKRINEIVSKIFRNEDYELLKIQDDRKSWYISFILFFILAICQGLVLYPIVQNIVGDPGPTYIQWILILGAYPVARMIGQVSMLFPGGLGMREGAFVLLTFSVLGLETATVIAIWARLLQLSAELVMFGFSTIAFALFQNKPKKQ
ncbi:lysylphosphatidylglycerol synthase domain-containing protein [Candidatus Omnitrophota bacterium]